MKLSWGEKSAKSFGNGVLRISVRDAIAAVLFLLALWKGVDSFKNSVKDSTANNSKEIAKVGKQVAEVSAQVDAVKTAQEELSDRVLVIETVARTTAEIRSRVKNIQQEDIFDPNVTQVKVKR